MRMLETSISRLFAPDDGAGGAAAPAEAAEVVVDDAGSAFEDGDDLDVVIVDSGGPKREKKEEPAGEAAPSAIEALLAAQAAQSKALADGLAGLGEGLKKQPVNVPQQPIQQVGESDEDFYKRIEEEAYKPGQFGKALQEAMGRQLGPLVAGFQQEILETKKQLLVHDPDLGQYYKRFKDEVDQRVASLPRNQLHGGIYRQVLQAVMAEKGPELQAETVAEQVRKGIEEGLKAAGIDPATKKPIAAPAVAVQALGGRGGAVETKSAAPREQLKVTNSDVNEMIALGLISQASDVRKDSPYLDNIKAFIRRKNARGGK